MANVEEFPSLGSRMSGDTCSSEIAGMFDFMYI